MLRIARSSLGQIRDPGFAAIFVAVTASLGNPAAGQNQAPTVDRPPTPTAGDTRTYKWDGQIVVSTYIGQKNGLNCHSEKAADGRQSEECRTSDDNLVSRVGTWEPYDCTPSCERVSFPLFVGKRWDASYRIPRPLNARGLGGGLVSISARVVSYEKVTVPAGTFDAFKIEAWAHAAGRQGYAGGDITEYYAPQFGIIKYDENYKDYQTFYSISWELFSYNRAKPGS
jgi:hypothetical protein